MNPSTAIKITNVSKQYRLGLVGTGTLSHDLKRWWTMNVLGKEDPNLRVGEANVRDKYGDTPYVWALKDIDLEIEQGDVVGIIGKNGAGKSTLLKILSRVTKPTTGTIEYRGRLASLLEVGTGFHPEMTGRENIYMNGSIMGMSRHEITRKLDEIIAFAGVERYIDTPVKRYSSGMTVRLGFSVAAHLEPDILVVDEVLAVGDAEFQKKAIGKMQDVSKGGGRTVLFVSHNMIAVRSLCTKGILLNNGSIHKTGVINSVIEEYLACGSYSSNVSINNEKEGLFLKSIMIQDNGIPGNFYIEEDLVFDIFIEAKTKVNRLNVNLFFNAPEGGLIFATVSKAEEVLEGNYLYRCVIPAYTLNDNAYTIDVMTVRDENYGVHYIKDAISIQGLEKKRGMAWMGKFPGLIRPQKFEWNRHLI